MPIYNNICPNKHFTVTCKNKYMSAIPSHQNLWYFCTCVVLHSLKISEKYFEKK